MADETIATAGSGLVFKNTYVNIPAAYLAGYRSAVHAAEDDFESHLTTPITLNVTFEFAPLDGEAVAANDFKFAQVSYTALRGALSSHATTADDKAAVNSLPASDPSRGAGFAVPLGLAQVLGLARVTANNAITVILDSTQSGWQFGSDVVGTLEHEISEGALGRIGGLGYASTSKSAPSLWGPLDLFRYAAPGQRSYTADGSPAYFSVDGSNLATQVQFHNQSDGRDLGDWQAYTGDAFGATGPGTTTTISSIDWRLLDILGWTPAGVSAPNDDYANGLADTSNPFGQASVGQSVNGTINYAGDRDWFRIQLSAGVTYAIDLTGGTLSNPYLLLHDSSGATIAANDDISPGINLNSEIVFAAPTSGTYYLEAGASGDSFTGQYTIGVQAVGAGAGSGSALPSLPAYRFFDAGDGGHFFTTSPTERDHVIATRSDMQYEGIAFLTDNPAAAGAVPVYRFFDPGDGGHFFTDNQTERDQVLAIRPDLRYEGIGFYEHASPTSGYTPVYRFFDVQDGGHFFTSSETERAAVLATRPDLHYEGIGFYAPLT